MSDEKIKVSPIEPRYVVRAIAQPGKDIDNFDFQFLIQIGDTYYDLCPNKIKIVVPTCDKIMMTAQIDLNDMIIDMPATMVDEEGQLSKARFRLVAQHDFPGQHAIHSSADVTEVTADGESIYAKTMLLEADGEKNGNKLTVQTILPPSEKRQNKALSELDDDEHSLSAAIRYSNDLNETAQLRKDNKALRMMLWLRHGHDGLYGDDGEMQCNMAGCMIDFKRDSIETIKQRWRSEGQRKIEAAGGMEAVLKQIREPNPVRTGREINLDGHVDDKGIQYTGKACEMTDGTWKCVAIVEECLCVVEVMITREQEKTASRNQDQSDLDSGKITKAELREINSYFAVDAKVDFGQDDF